MGFDRFANGMWIETFTGRRFPVLDPHPDDVDIRDVAQSLSRTCRYNGHVRLFYSVAEHSVLLADYALANLGEAEARVMLLHDAAEAYLGDIVRPVKRCLDVDKIERALEWAVFAHFGLHDVAESGLPDWAKELDNRILVDEHDRVMNRPSVNRWATDALEPLGVRVRCLEPWQAGNEFMRRFFKLFPDHGG